MKQKLSLFLGCFLLAAGLLAQEHAGDFTVSFAGGGLTIETYEGKETTVAIPSQIDGHPVRRIASWAFTGKSVERIIIPGTVVSVSEKAFYGCRNLFTIEFLGRLPQDNRPFKGLPAQKPSVRFWDNLLDEEAGNYRGLPLERAFLQPMPLPIRLDGKEGHLFEQSMTLTFPEPPAGTILRYNENFREPTSVSPRIEGGAQKTLYEDCHISLRLFADDGTPVSGVTFLTYGRIDKPKNLVANDVSLRLCTCQGEPGRLEVEGIKSFAPVVTLPAMLDGKPVFNLCSPAGWTCNTLAVFLPDDIGQCGYSFADNHSLEYIRFPNGVDRLTTGIAANCPALARIELPPSLQAIGEKAFADCGALAEVNLPPSLTLIAREAFRNCQAITSVTFPSTLAEIGEEAFAGCNALTDIVFCGPPPRITGKVFPESVRQILVQPGLGWPEKYDGIPVIPFNASLQIVRTDGEESSFFQRTLQISLDVQPELTALCYSVNGGEAVSYTDPFTIDGTALVTAQAMVNGEPYGPVFSRQFVKTDDETLQESFTQNEEGIWILTREQPILAIAEGLVLLNGFSTSKNSLVAIHIPADVTSLAGEAPMSGPEAANPFAGQMLLREIDVHPDNDCFTLIDGVLFDADCTTLLAYPPARSDESYEIPEGVLFIAANAFAGACNLKALTLPDTLLSIGSSAFRDMAQLTELAIPEGVATIPDFACQGCTSLERVELPFLLESIFRSAFQGCASLREINLPPFLKVIGDNALRNCGALQYLEIPAGLKLLCISALFGVHENCQLFFKGCYSSSWQLNDIGIGLLIWGNGAARDEETDVYLLPHLAISYIGSRYGEPDFWPCFEADEDAYYELLTFHNNSATHDLYSDLYLNDCFITLADDWEEDGGESYKLVLEFRSWGYEDDNFVMAYTLDGSEPTLENGFWKEFDYYVGVWTRNMPFLFRSAVFDRATGEQLLGEINYLARETAPGESFFAYGNDDYDNMSLDLTECLNRRFFTAGYLGGNADTFVYGDSYRGEYIHLVGDFLSKIPRGDLETTLHLPPYSHIVDEEALAKDSYHRVVSLSWELAWNGHFDLWEYDTSELPSLHDTPKAVVISRSLAEAVVNWIGDGRYLNASLEDVNSDALAYSLEGGGETLGNLRVADDVLFSGDTLLAYPGTRDEKSYVIPNGTKTIAPYAFCANVHTENQLLQVAVPASVTYVGELAFATCSHLTDLYFLGREPAHPENGSIFENMNKECTLHAFPGSGFAESYDAWYEMMEKKYLDGYLWYCYYTEVLKEIYGDYYEDYYPWRRDYATFGEYLDHEWQFFFWNTESIVTEGRQPPLFTLQEDGLLALELPDEEWDYLRAAVAPLIPQPVIRYTTDGTRPDASSTLYTGPIEIPEACNVVRAIACIDDYPCSIPAAHWVRRPLEDETVCEEEWLLVEEALSPAGQPVLTPPGREPCIYRHTETFLVEEKSRLAFHWRMDGNGAAMTARLDGLLIARQDGYVPWQSITLELSPRQEHTLEWECDYTAFDKEEETEPPDMFLGQAFILASPELFTISLPDGTLLGSFAAGEDVNLLPELRAKSLFLNWRVTGHDDSAMSGGSFAMPAQDIVATPYYSQPTDYEMVPGWNLLGNVWLFENATRSSECVVTALNPEEKAYFKKRLDEISEGEAFWFYWTGMEGNPPLFASNAADATSLAPGWHLLPGGMDIPADSDIFLYDAHANCFRRCDDNANPAVGYWVYIP